MKIVSREEYLSILYEVWQPRINITFFAKPDDPDGTKSRWCRYEIIGACACISDLLGIEPSVYEAFT